MQNPLKKLFTKKITCVLLKDGEFIKRKKVPITELSFNYDKGVYAINLKKAIPINKRKKVLFYDINDSIPLGFVEEKHEDAKILATLISRRALKSIFGAENDYFLFLVISMITNVGLIIILYLKFMGVF